MYDGWQEKAGGAVVREEAEAGPAEGESVRHARSHTVYPQLSRYWNPEFY